MYKYVFLLLTLLGLTACGNPSKNSASSKWFEKNGKLKVLSTTAMIDDLVRQIGGDHIDTTVLIKGELDPHSYQLVKGDDEKLTSADLIVFNGLGLEHGPSLQHYLEASHKTLGVGNKIEEADPSLILQYMGQRDPHIWMDMSMWAKTIPYIVETLSQKDPEHANDYKKNGERLTAELKKAHEEIRQELQSIPDQQRYLVTSHDAFNYFTRAYLAAENETKQSDWQKRFEAPEGLAPESQLSATDIQKTIDHLLKYQIHMLFPESNISKDSIRKIVQAGGEKGLNLKIANNYLYADAMGAPGSDGDTYIKMIQHNAQIIKENLLNNHPH